MMPSLSDPMRGLDVAPWAGGRLAGGCPETIPRLSRRAAGRVRWVVLGWVILLGLALPGWSAEFQTFLLGGTPVRLERQDPARVSVHYRAMRLNRASGDWNVEVTVSNQANASLRGPVVLRFEELTQSTGLRTRDGVDAAGKEFLDVTAWLTEGVFPPGSALGPFTLSFGRAADLPAPTIQAVVYAPAPVEGTAPLLATRTLDEAGLPLSGVMTGGAVSGRGGWVTVPVSPGQRWVRFEAEGRWPVFEPVPPGTGLQELPTPRLTRRATQTSSIGGVPARWTPLTPQTLVAPLPEGWSPLAGAVIEFASVPAAPVGIEWATGTSVAADETVALARWNEAEGIWRVVATGPGRGADPIPLAVPGSGAFVLAIADAGGRAAGLGEALKAATLPIPSAGTWQATSSVNPPTRPASTVPELVTAVAEVVLRSTAGALPSGVRLRAEIREEYRLRDGSRRVTPQYQTSLRGFRRPGAGEPGTLTARFPLRPQLLLPGEELAEAKVTVDVLPPESFAAGVLTPDGGLLESGPVQVLAGVDVVPGTQVARVTQPNESLSDLPIGGLELATAFELDLSGVAPGRGLTLRVAGLLPGSDFVLARSVFEAGQQGVQPVLRLRTDAAGRLVSAEPGEAAGQPRMPGLDGGGQYLLLRAAGPLALVRGIVRDRTGQPAPGVAVRSGPWLTFTDALGAYQLVASVGPGEVTAADPQSGDTGVAVIRVENGGAGLTAEVGMGPQGPRVVGVAPASGAVGVSRVAPVALTFSEPVNPATLVVPGAVELLDATGTALPASVSLNLARTVVSVLPRSQLPAARRLTLRLGTGVTDVSGAPLEGTREWQFTTETDALERGQAGQLVIYQPGAARVPAEVRARIAAFDPVRDRDGIVVLGTVGTAEAGRPVILVNESTGETATVLAAADGSFVSLVRGGEDDLISCVLVNANGTRNRIPASRQFFDDGSVGLFSGGGKVEFPSEVGPMQVIIDPGAIATRTRFWLAAVAKDEVDAAVAVAPLTGAKVVGGFRFETEGEALRIPARLRLPATAATLGLTPGQAPEDVLVVLGRQIEVEGVTVYEGIDTARFDGTGIETERTLEGFTTGMAPSGGAGTAGAPAGAGTPRRQARPQFLTALGPGFFLALQVNDAIRRLTATTTGFVTSAAPNDAGNLDETTRRPVVGAAVRSVNGGYGPGRRLVPGDLVALSDESGRYRVISPLGQEATLVQMEATSPLFLNQIAIGRRSMAVNVFGPNEPLVFRVDLGFARGVGGALAARDKEAPQVVVSHNPDFLETLLAATVRVFAQDDLKLATLEVSALDLRSPTGAVLSATNLTLTLQSGSVEEPMTIRRSYDAVAAVPLRATIRALATDAAGKTNEVRYPLILAARDPLVPPLDTNDHTGPFISGSTPVQEAEGVLPGTSIRLEFSEAVERRVLDRPTDFFTLSPAAGTPNCFLRDGGRTVELSYPQLRPGQRYHLSVSTLLRDLNGNRFDQNPYNNTAVLTLDAFTLRFTMAELDPAVLPELTGGAGVVTAGDFLAAINRVGGGRDELILYDVSRPDHPTIAGRTKLQAYPRAIASVPGFSFRRRYGGPVEKQDLIVVGGGLAGGEGQWIEGYVVGSLGSLTRVVRTLLSPSPVAVVTKLQWAAPKLAYLESDADQTSVGLIDLQLLILAEHLSEAEFAAQVAGGDAGLDANGDGDYVDAEDRLPRPDGSRPRFGVLNAGLVARYLLPEGSTKRIRDFEIAFGGNFVGVLATQPGGTSEYRTLVAGGQLLGATGPALDLGGEGRKLKLLFGQTLESSLAGDYVANLALVTMTGGPRLVVIDITDPRAPASLNSIDLPAEHGLPQGLQGFEGSQLAVMTPRDVLLIEGRRLALQPGVNGAPHPAVVGWVPGFGAAGHPFVASSQPLFATASGSGRVAGRPSVVQLTLHRPGTLRSPGPVVPDLGETDAARNLLLVNDDHDDGVVPAADTDPNQRYVDPDASPIYATGDNQRPVNSLTDSRDSVVGARDNDLAVLDLARVPRLPNSRFGQVQLTFSLADASGAPPLRIYARQRAGSGEWQAADITGLFASGAGGLSLSLDLESGTTTPAFSILGALRTGAVTLAVEGLTPCGTVSVKLEYRDPANGTTLSDSVVFSVVKLRLTEVWSDQYAGQRSNLLPGRTGRGGYGDARYDYILMAPRSTGDIHVGARVTMTPEIAGAMGAVRVGLVRQKQPATADDFQVWGTTSSDGAGGVFLVRSPDPRPTFVMGVDSRTAYLPFFVGVGLDANGDGELDPLEVQDVYGTAYPSAGKLVTSRLLAEEGVLKEKAFRDPHLKVISRAMWLQYQVPIGSLMTLLDNFQASVDSLILPVIGNQPNQNEVRSLGLMHLRSFITGTRPLVLAPIDNGSYFNPDVSSATEQNYLGHNVGSFATARHRELPLYEYGNGLSMPDRILFSADFRTRCTLLLGGARARALVRNYWNEFPSATGVDLELTFTEVSGSYVNAITGGKVPGCANGAWDGIEWGRLDEAPLTVGGQFIGALNNCLDIDLALGIGGWSMRQLRLKFHVEADQLPFGPQTTFKATQVRATGRMFDIYDWDLEVIPFFAVVQAGHETFGAGGRPFAYEIPIDDVLPLFEAVIPNAP